LAIVDRDSHREEGKSKPGGGDGVYAVSVLEEFSYFGRYIAVLLVAVPFEGIQIEDAVVVEELGREAEGPTHS
jgi:hypothetical protein